jgi:hypothetical protein
MSGYLAGKCHAAPTHSHLAGKFAAVPTHSHLAGPIGTPAVPGGRGDTTPPSGVTFTLTRVAAALTVSAMSATDDVAVARYELYYSTSSTPPDGSTTPLDSCAYVGSGETFAWTGTTNATNYAWVRAVDTSENAGPWGSSQSMAVPTPIEWAVDWSGDVVYEGWFGQVIKSGLLLPSGVATGYRQLHGTLTVTGTPPDGWWYLATNGGALGYGGSTTSPSWSVASVGVGTTAALTLRCRSYTTVTLHVTGTLYFV